MAITRPFFELQTPDSAWKYGLPAGIPAKKIDLRDSLNIFLKFGKIKDMAITRPFFEIQSPDFA